MRSFTTKALFTIIFALTILFSFSGCTADNSHSPQTEANEISSASKETVIVETDTEIVLREGHPRWLDDMSAVYTTWQDAIDNGKVVIPGAWDTLYGEKHILEINELSTNYGDEGTSYIGGIIFHFSHFDTQLSLDDALSIIKTYLPQDTIQQYYYEERSFFEVEEGDYANIRYVKCFRLIDNNDNIPEKLNTTFDILIWTDMDGNVTEAKIANVAFADFENIQKWEYDIFS